jgi:hypothetical protein
MVTMTTDTEFDGGSMVTIERGLAPIGIRVPEVVETNDLTTHSDL